MALALTVLAAWLHWVFLNHAGALWRDEAAFVHIATLPTWSEVWTMQALDHCPLLPFALVRGWVALGPGAGDFGLRVLGAGLGVALLATLWFAARTVRGGAPLLALALLATNLTVVRFTASLRGYGLGCVLGVLTFALVWRVVQRPTWRRAALAAVVAVLSVQSLYQNAFFLFAAGCGGMLVGALRRDWRAVGLIAAVGLVAALSLAPYVPLLRHAQDAYVIVKRGFDPETGWENLALAAGHPWAGAIWIWCGLVVASIMAALVALWRCRGVPGRDGEAGAVVFAGTALPVGIGGFAVFLHTADFPTHAWYYVPLLVFGAVCIDVALPAAQRVVRRATPVVAVAAAVAALLVGPATLRLRQTNIDQLAAHLAREAQPGDFILVHPWYAGITFARYYRGPVKWDTLPPLADHGLHRYDLLKERLQAEDPVQPVLAAIADALRAGRRVWVVGGIPISPQPPPTLPPAPRGPRGWEDEPYSQIWGAQAGHVLALRATHGVVAVDPSGAAVSPYENAALLEFSGWRWQAPVYSPW